MPNGEDVRLKVDHVKSKKVEGTLYMMSERMGWMPKHKDVFTLSFDYCDIKCKLLSYFKNLNLYIKIIVYHRIKNLKYVYKLFVIMK
jgi:transcription initiation factor TFIIH subunit 1